MRQQKRIVEEKKERKKEKKRDREKRNRDEDVKLELKRNGSPRLYESPAVTANLGYEEERTHDTVHCK